MTLDPQLEPAIGRISVLIADDEEVARTLVAAYINDDPTLELVGQAVDADEAIALAVRWQPDVAVLDLNMPGGGGWRAAEVIGERSPRTQTIALTAMDTPEAQYESMRSGVVSFLTKGSSKEKVLETIKSAVRWRVEDAGAELTLVQTPADASAGAIEDALGPLGDLLRDQAEQIAQLEERVAKLERGTSFGRDFR